MIIMLLSKKTEDTIDPVRKAQKDNFNATIRQARDTLVSDVQSALNYSKLLTILPNTSKEYQYVESELDFIKNDVATDIATYEKCRKELYEFCITHGMATPEWVNAYEIAAWATKEK